MRYFIVLMLCFSLMPLTLNAGETTIDLSIAVPQTEDSASIADNTSVSDQSDYGPSLLSTISPSNPLAVATFTYESNSVDGFSFNLASSKSGILSITGDADAETVPFEVHISDVVGTQGYGTLSNSGSTANSVSTAEGATFIASTITGRTTGTFTVSISSEGNADLLEGTYSDTLTLTVSDL